MALVSPRLPAMLPINASVKVGSWVNSSPTPVISPKACKVLASLIIPEECVVTLHQLDLSTLS